MLNLIYLTILTALFVNGLQIATSENMLLNFVKRKLDYFFIIDLVPGIDPENPEKIIEKPVYSKLYYPILYCVKCMPSIYGTALCFIFLPVTVQLFYQIPIVLFCSCCLSAILFQFYE